MDISVKPRGGGSLTREQFLLREIRIVATLRLQGLSDGEIVQRVLDENLFQYPSKTNLRRIANVCLARLNALDAGVPVVPARLTVVLADGMPAPASQVNLYAMMLVYPLVRSFMTECVGERMAHGNFHLTRTDLNAFFTNLQLQDPSAAAWTENTSNRIKSTLWNLLVQAGYLPNRTSETLQRPLLDPTVKDGIVANGHAQLLIAFGEAV